MLARVVSVVGKFTITVQEVLNRTDTANPGPETPSPIPRALTKLRSPLTLRLERLCPRPLPHATESLPDNGSDAAALIISGWMLLPARRSLVAAPSRLTPQSPTA